MSNFRTRVLAMVLFALMGSLLSAQDAVSMASPDREAIWTARLLIIAINDSDERTARAMFAPDAAVTFFDRSIPATDRDDWLSNDVFDAGVGVRVRQNHVDGRVIRITADWQQGESLDPVVLTFVQSDDGRIESLDVTKNR